MATGKIEKVTNAWGNNYCKMPDGTLICWGSDTIIVTDTPPDRKQFTFPVAFASAPSVFFQVEENSYNVQPILLIWGLNTTSCYALNRASTPSRHILFKWLAVGRWK